jgi:hypothetical protein
MAGIFDAFLKGLLGGASGSARKRAKSPIAKAVAKAVTPQKPKAKPKSKAPARGHGEYAQEVVGESNYQPALRAIQASKDKPFHRARLVPEDANPFDNLAVRVDVAGHTVGYLPRADARRWRKSSGPGTCDAFIADAGPGTNLGVWLRL